MATAEFYASLDYDFSIYEGEEELRGLTIGGFNGNKPLNINDFNQLELKAARDIIAFKFSPIQTFNQSSTSYGLKHLVESALKIETNGEVNYVSNGTLILAMYDAGYRIKREKGTSPNCYFNVSKKSVDKLSKFVNSAR